MECCICFQQTTNWVAPCQHLMCEPCALKWFHTKANSCPMCRGIVLSPAPTPRVVGPGIKIVCTPSGTLGVVVESHARGVKVLTVDKAGDAYACGLRKGDVVTHMNAIPLRSTEQAVDMLDRAKDCSYPLCCAIDPHKKRLPRVRLALRKMARARLVWVM